MNFVNSKMEILVTEFVICFFCFFFVFFLFCFLFVIHTATDRGVNRHGNSEKFCTSSAKKHHQPTGAKLPPKDDSRGHSTAGLPGPRKKKLVEDDEDHALQSKGVVGLCQRSPLQRRQRRQN
jgi:hypothetical protein